MREIVRVSDILALALSALFKQKIRTLLTTLGVIFGSCVLVVSLSIGQGVQETVVRQYQKFGELRTINVFVKFVPDPAQEEKKERVREDMDEAKRKRLKEELAERDNIHYPQIPQVYLTKDYLKKITALDHVEVVEPVWVISVWAGMGSKKERATISTAGSFNTNLNERIVTGRWFSDANKKEVLVSEYLMYQLGIVNKAQEQQILGQNLKVEIQFVKSRPGLQLGYALDVESKITSEEERVLEKVMKQLPSALDKFQLTPQEKIFLKSVLDRSPGPTKQPSLVFEFPICGVFKREEDDQKPLVWGWHPGNPDVILPRKAAEAFYETLPVAKKFGYDRALVKVDDLNYAKEVDQKIRDMGFNTFTPMRLIEREQFIYLMVFSVMTIVSLVALVVAALGITNTMFMSVLERVREIGIMKAVGARKRHILLIFLIEGALIGLVGGLLGLLCGWLISFPSDAWVVSLVESRLSVQLEKSIFVYSWWVILGVPLFACLVTTLAAFFPARRAASINPVTALRHE